jgi:hypothetical protein
MIAMKVLPTAKYARFRVTTCNECPCFLYDCESSGNYREYYMCNLHNKRICDADDWKEDIAPPKWCEIDGTTERIRRIISGG